MSIHIALDINNGTVGETVCVCKPVVAGWNDKRVARLSGIAVWYRMNLWRGLAEPCNGFLDQHFTQAATYWRSL